MAQIQEKASRQTGGKRRAKKLGSHLDMTPMVDLACLLLTFFMLTTTFVRLQTMELSMPVPHQVGTAVSAKNALTLILGEHNRVFYYFGFPGDAPAVSETDFSANGLRKVLLSEEVKANPNMVVLVKAMERSRYRNLVDALDELKLTGTKKYALVNLQDEDKDLIAGKLEATASAR
jgi:biopolymer transport protein ExbD